MNDYIFNVSLFLAGALAIITAIGYHTEAKADRRRRVRAGSTTARMAAFGRDPGR